MISIKRPRLRIAHVADLHFRGLHRHDEFRETLTHFFDECKKREVNAIVVAGDVWHTKTQGFTPEAIDLLVWFFKSAADICDVYVIPGNHDLNLHNTARQDALSPIITALDNERIHYFKSSGVYPGPFDDYFFCVYSCVDESLGAWDRVCPVDGKVNIALYHGSVIGATTDDGWHVESSIDVDFFKDYSFALLGDIHKRQYLAHRDVVIEIDEDELKNYPDAEIVDENALV